MSITTTPLLDLIKPDKLEAIRNWPWQNLINCIILDNRARVQFSTYTPVLTGATSNPVLGTGGEIEGKRIRVGNRLNIVFGRFRFGTSGINAGDGTYFFSLPVAADTSLHNISSDRAFDIIGRWTLRDNNVIGNTHLGSVELSDSLSNEAVAFNYGYGSGDFVSSSNPFTPGTEDALNFYCMYQEAE